MKKINSVLVCLVIFTLAHTNNANAQGGKDFISTNSSGEKQVVNFPVPENAVSAKPTVKDLKAQLREARANSKVTGYISNNLKNVSGLQIYMSDNEPILAKFKMHDKSVRITFDKKGNWLYTITSYKEDDLPPAVKSLVKSSLPGI
jgi:hypothetical protein